MKRPLHLIKPGILKIEGESLLFIDKDKKKIRLPIKEIDQINIYSQVSLSSGVIKTTSKENIPIYFINKYGVLYNILEPPTFIFSGRVKIKQAKNFLDLKKRINFAKKFVLGAYYNLNSFFKRYGINLEFNISKINNVVDISELMGCKLPPVKDRWL